MFGLDDLDIDENDHPTHSDDFVMIFHEEEDSIVSQHSTSKPKEKLKKKKLVVSRKEFLSLQSKFDQILATITTAQPQQSEIIGPQSLAERVERLAVRERLATGRISLNVEIGIRALDNARTADHREFLSNVETLIQ